MSQYLIDKINQHIKTLIALEVVSQCDIINNAIKQSIGMARLDLLNEIKKKIDLIQSGVHYEGNTERRAGYEIKSSIDVID